MLYLAIINTTTCCTWYKYTRYQVREKKFSKPQSGNLKQPAVIIISI